MSAPEGHWDKGEFTGAVPGREERDRTRAVGGRRRCCTSRPLGIDRVGARSERASQTGTAVPCGGFSGDRWDEGGYRRGGRAARNNATRFGRPSVRISH